MKEELTAKMHSEFSISEETEISHRVSCVVAELSDGGSSLNELLDDYNVTLEQYNKFKSEWE